MTAERLAAWGALCEWFNEQPYKASYSPHYYGCPNTYLLCRAIDPPTRKVVQERRRIQVIYWRPGKGWQLRKDWREKLAALRDAREDKNGDALEAQLGG